MTEIEEFIHHQTIFRDKAFKALMSISVEFANSKDVKDKQTIAIETFNGLLTTLSSLRPWIYSNDFNTDTIAIKIQQSVGSDVRGISLTGDLIYALVNAVGICFTSVQLASGISAMSTAKIAAGNSANLSRNVDSPTTDEAKSELVLKFAISCLFTASIEELNGAVGRANEIFGMLLKNEDL